MTDPDAAHSPEATTSRRRVPGRSGPVIGRSITDRLARTPAASGPIRLRGFVRQGVEHGTLVLVDDRGTVLAQLLGYPDRAAVDGPPVIVTGSFRTDVLTTGQQGTPFRVDRVDRA